jgi:hypothetical protein
MSLETRRYLVVLLCVEGGRRYSAQIEHSLGFVNRTGSVMRNCKGGDRLQ